MTGTRASYRLLPPKHRYRFRVGEKARCVVSRRSTWLSASDLSPSKMARQPQDGVIYVVRAVQPYDGGHQMLALRGIDGWWLASSFRPVVESKAQTDISALTALLRPVGRQKEASNA